MGFSIDRNIRRLRKEAGLTQEELAQKLFVTRQTISLWELGKVHPDLETLQKLAEQFQVDLLQVLYGPEYTPAQQLLRRLPVWAGLSGGLALLLWGVMVMAEWSLVQPGMIATPAFFVVGMPTSGCRCTAVRCCGRSPARHWDTSSHRYFPVKSASGRRWADCWLC